MKDLHNIVIVWHDCTATTVQLWDSTMEDARKRICELIAKGGFAASTGLSPLFASAVNARTGELFVRRIDLEGIEGVTS